MNNPASRFRADLARLCDPARDRVLVAVSGGADSLALLLLAREALGDRCLAATVDHRLRPESGVEAAQVAAICAVRAIPHATLSAPLPDRTGRTANLSARARALRYRLLEAHADASRCAVIATAHHADDQLETVIMRLNRGAGVAGLAGVRARSGRVIRPLLGWRRAELAAIAADAGLSPVEDPSNTDPRFDRARLRRALAQADWLDPGRVAASAKALADAEDALAWTTDLLGQSRCAFVPSAAVLRPENLPFELQLRLVERCIRHVDPDAAPDGPTLVRAIERLAADCPGTLGAVAYRVCAREWRFTPAPPRQRP